MPDHEPDLSLSRTIPNPGPQNAEPLCVPHSYRSGRPGPRATPETRLAMPVFGWQGLLVASLLTAQLALVGFIAAKHAYDRWNYPRVWTIAAVTDRSFSIDGVYLSLRIAVDGCQSTLPSAKQAVFGRNVDGSANASPFVIAGAAAVLFPARLQVRDQKLLAVRLPESDKPVRGETVVATPGSSCQQMHLASPLKFYLPESVRLPSMAEEGDFWIELAVPPVGPPQPLQLAVRQGNEWHSLGRE